MEIGQLETALKEHHQFPGPYTFKFIVPKGLKQQARALLEGAEVSERESSSGTYVSVTMQAQMDSVQDVIDVYRSAHKIDRLIAL